MVFSSVTFIFCFLPLTIVGYYLIGKKAKNYWLLLMSLFFYAWSGLNFLPVIIISIIWNYLCGFLIDQFEAKNKQWHKKIGIVVAITGNLLFLGYWKYLNFTAETISTILNVDIHIARIILPIGISFFTFQGMSYVIDVYRKQVPVQKNPLIVGLYIALFPQLIAGPIVRYSDIAQQFEERTHSTSLFCSGIRRFSLGLFKKAVFANTLAVNADAIFGLPQNENTVAVAWLGVITYMLQIYYDFSGYSDMAIGLGRMFGFQFMENFDYPYMSKSIAEYWRRWHISLGVWFKDYLFYPIMRTQWCQNCGKRIKNKNIAKSMPTVIATLIVWTLTGIWHGANWTFLFYGLYFGIIMAVVTLLKKPIKNFNKKYSFTKTHLYDWFRILRTCLIVGFAFLIFKLDSMSAAWDYFKSMFGMLPLQNVGYTWSWYLDKYTTFIMLCAIIFAFPIRLKITEKLKQIMRIDYVTLVMDIVGFSLLGIGIVYVIVSNYNPFIYFQF